MTQQKIRNSLYFTGKNLYGQLGQNPSSQSNIRQFKKTNLQDEMSNTKITKVTMSTSATLYVTADGKLYAAGSNNKGQLGLDLSISSVNQFQKVKYFEDNNITVVDVATGKYDTIVLDKDGNVYSLGKDYYTQDDTQNLCISKIDFNQKVKQITAFDDTYAVLTVGDTIYFYGTPIPGWESLCMEGKCNTLTELSSQGIIPREIQLGQDRLFVIVDDTTIYVSGQDGPEICTEQQSNDSLFTKITLEFNIEKISQGHSHTLLLSKDGVVYGCGINNYYQLGRNNTKDKIYTPTLITENIGGIIDIASTSYGSWIRTNEDVYRVGKQDYGELSLNKSADKQTQQTWKKLYIDDDDDDDDDYKINDDDDDDDDDEISIRNLNYMAAGETATVLYGQQEQSDNLSTGAIVGIAIGSVIGVVIIVIIIVITVCYIKNKKNVYAYLEIQPENTQ